jgi:hypothetical protein
MVTIEKAAGIKRSWAAIVPTTRLPVNQTIERRKYGPVTFPSATSSVNIDKYGSERLTDQMEPSPQQGVYKATTIFHA